MENSIIDTIENNTSTNLTATSISFIKEIAKWGKLLSITGFLMMGIFALASIYMFYTASISSYFLSNQLYISGGTYLVMIILYFFPTMYLYKFSIKTTEGFKSGDKKIIETAFENLKSMFKFIGIFTIIIIAIYILIALFGLFAFIMN